jgi:zinc transporter ZupT
VLVLTCVSCAIPSAILKYCGGQGDGRSRQIFLYLLMFSCSLIMCTGVNHVLPNAIDAFDDYESGSYARATIITTFVMILSWALDILMDPRKQSITVAYSTVLVDTNDDLPPADPWLFTGAIFIHSILEGLVLGAAPVETGSATRALYVITAVLTLHKCFEGFALATIYEAYEYDTAMKVVLLLLYSLLTPVGILVGLLVTIVFSGYTSLVAGISCAISAGIFIYAGVSLLVSRVMPDYLRTNWRYPFVAAGWFVSSAVAYYA